MEQWHDVKGFEGIYKVSSLGRIKSLTRTITYKNGAKHLTKGKMLKPIMDSYGYYRATLYKNGHAYQRLVHRIVADEFVSNPNNYSDINHKNEMRTDNRSENLEWCTKKYNNNYGRHNDHLSLAKCKSIYQLDSDHNIIAKWKSINEAVQGLKLPKASHCNISACLHGRIQHAYGYTWRFAE